MLKLILSSIFLFISVSHAEMVETPFRLSPYRGGGLESQFIQLNEWFDALYKPECEGLTGAAITTGTFRAFQKILYGNFEWVFVIDINPRVLRFNKLNYQTIVEAKSRKEYLENFPDIYQRTFGEYPPDYDSKEGKFGSEKKHPLFEMLSRDNAEDYLISETDFPAGKSFFDQFYFNNDQAFNELQNKLRITKIVFLQQSVTSKVAAIQIASFLNSQHIKISLLDLSNIIDYLLLTPNRTSFDTRRTRQLIEFIRTLPLSEKTKAIFTISLSNSAYRELLGPDEHGQNVDSFRYFVGTTQNLIDILQRKPRFSTAAPKRLQTSTICRLHLGE